MNDDIFDDKLKLMDKRSKTGKYGLSIMQWCLSRKRMIH